MQMCVHRMYNVCAPIRSYDMYTLIKGILVGIERGTILLMIQLNELCTHYSIQNSYLLKLMLHSVYQPNSVNLMAFITCNAAPVLEGQVTHIQVTTGCISRECRT